MNRRRLQLLTVAAAVCFVITALVPLGRPTTTVELVARAEGDGGQGHISWSLQGVPVPEQVPFLLAPPAAGLQLQTVHLPVRDPAVCRLSIEAVGRLGVSFLLSDLRVSSRRGIRTSLWSIDPGLLEPSDRLALEQVKTGLWRVSAPSGVPQIDVDLARFEPVSFLRAGTAAWFLFWTALALLAVGLSTAAHPIPLSRLLVYAAALVLVAGQGWTSLKTAPYGVPPDEKAHVSYLIHLDETGRFFPDYKSRFLYSERGARLDHRNDLAHPPFYYHLLKPFAPHGPRPIVSRFHDLRLVNLALGLCGLGLFFWVGCREPLPLAFHIYYAAALSAVPMIPYLAGSVNNDNLVLLAGGLAVYGAILFLQSKARPWGLVLLGAGLSLALLVKATAGLQLLFLTGLVLALRIRRDRSIAAFRGFHLPLFAGLCLVPLAYYLRAYALYRTFLPQFGDVWYEIPQNPVVLSFFPYLRRFFRVLYLSWTGVLSHESVFRESLFSALPLVLPLVLAIWAFFLREKEESGPFFTVHRLALVSLALMMVFHFTRVYRYHLVSGYTGGMQARYYFPLIPCVLMLSFRPFINGLQRPAVRAALAILVAGLLLSGIWFYWFRLT